jgi:pimeloyl-ACP methyl ester carboxylesterase
MRILRLLVGAIVALLILVTLASVVHNAATADANVPVQKLWHGEFVDGTAYRRWGTHGRPIVLIGGFLEPTFVWQDVAPLLGAGFRVYALDLDGFGYSERRGPWTLAHWGDQVQQFVQALHLRKPLFVGHSLGAAIAVEEARRGLASGVVLVDGDALASGGPPRFVRVALAHSPFFTTAYRLVSRSDWAVRKILANAYGPNHLKLDSKEIDRWTDQLRAKDARRALQGMVENGIPGFTSAELRQMHLRALVLWGAHDSVDSESAGRQTARDLHAPFVELPNAGHLSMLAAAARMTTAVAQFFRGAAG